MKTVAAVLHEAGKPLEIEEVELEPPRAREVQVRLAGAAICHSDLYIIEGTGSANLPVICGHEGAGVVTAVGPGVVGLAEGDHVVLSWSPSCGRCSFCLTGQPSLCETTIEPSYGGFLWDGTSRFTGADGQSISHYCMASSFARDVVVPDGGAVRVRDDVSLPPLAVIGCAVPTGVGAAARTGNVQVGSRVAVIGVGGVGLNAVQGARLCGARQVIAVDIAPWKLERALTFGATDLVDASAVDVVEAITSLSDGGVDVAIEAVGTPRTVEAAVRSLRRAGIAVVVGLAAPGATIEVSLEHLIEGRQIRGSYYGSSRPIDDIPKLVDLYRERRLLVDELISETLALEEINIAVAHLAEGSVTRSLITF